MTFSSGNICLRSLGICTQFCQGFFDDYLIKSAEFNQDAHRPSSCRNELPAGECADRRVADCLQQRWLLQAVWFPPSGSHAPQQHVQVRPRGEMPRFMCSSTKIKAWQRLCLGRNGCRGEKSLGEPLLTSCLSVCAVSCTVTWPTRRWWTKSGELSTTTSPSSTRCCSTQRTVSSAPMESPGWTSSLVTSPWPHRDLTVTLSHHRNANMALHASGAH